MTQYWTTRSHMYMLVDDMTNDHVGASIEYIKNHHGLVSDKPTPRDQLKHLIHLMELEAIQNELTDINY